MPQIPRSFREAAKSPSMARPWNGFNRTCNRLCLVLRNIAAGNHHLCYRSGIKFPGTLAANPSAVGGGIHLPDACLYSAMGPARLWDKNHRHLFIIHLDNWASLPYIAVWMDILALLAGTAVYALLRSTPYIG